MKYVSFETQLNKSNLKGVRSLGWRPPLLNREGAIWRNYLFFYFVSLSFQTLSNTHLANST